MFAERLKQLRKEAGYTNQTQIAEILKTSQQSYSQWESGKRRPSKTTLEKLSKFFNVSVDYLLGNSEIRNPEKAIELDFEKVKESLRKSLGYNGTDTIPEEELESMAQAFIEHFGQ
ncbi:helix-turn-helix domain-containing protein [Streptococcus suis]|uniref:helix-turn-helix domain-containing protein n=1 Tax=Streptococcus suis TaxID=1307 RepID=UPI0005CDE95F|nr:helix-turn-helix transcriptional regulator [Streptococcus suis]NQH21335.1 helix-turn-helix transcriptional regulator [Streptococcus suis]CYV12214.1 HTH-type transcriptional regulator yobD [Streptococcus suis]HEL1734895.1 helix-turn-helix transcriptional regulator [Streptococcus suis]